MKIHFVCTNSIVEKEVIRELKPNNLLLSYAYFKNKRLKDFVDEIGYTPNILLDSGAYTAFSKGKNISLIDYMRYIDENAPYIGRYITLDVIGNPRITRKFYEIMKMENYNPVPVYHYGDDIKYLQRYVDSGETYIALGKTVPITDKSKVAAWVNELTDQFPTIKFHLLGSSSRKVTAGTNLYSVDSSTWIMQAINGYPKEIGGKTREAKKKRALWQMSEHMTREGDLNGKTEAASSFTGTKEQTQKIS